MQFEFLKEKQIDSLVELLETSFELSVKKETLKKSLSQENPRFFCAVKEEKVIGTAMITTNFDPVQGEKSFYLDYVSVLPAYRNQKVGTSLLLEIEKLAKKEKISYLELTSSKIRIYARKMYTSLGYQIKDTNVFRKRLSE